MAHNIYTDRKGNSAFVGAKQSAWHSLGQVKEKHFTFKDGCESNPALNYHVEKRQLEFGGVQLEAWGTFRVSDEPIEYDIEGKEIQNWEYLASCGKDYVIHQHKLCGAVCDKLVGSIDGAHYETIGALGNGERVWGLINLNHTTYVGGKDEHKDYLAFLTSYDGSTKTKFFATRIRIVCQNTLNIALNEVAKMLEFKHTKNSETRMANVSDVLDNITQEFGSMDEKLDFLSKRLMTSEAFEKVNNLLWKPKTKITSPEELVDQTRRTNMLEAILRQYDDPSNIVDPSQKDTSFSYLQAITHFYDHEYMPNSDARDRAERATMGKANDTKSQALEVLVNVSKDLPYAPQTQIVTGYTTVYADALDRAVAQTPVTVTGKPVSTSNDASLLDSILSQYD